MTSTDQTPADVEPPAPQAKPRQRSAMWLVVGGVVAAVLGYGAALVAPFGPSSTQIADLQAALTAQGVSGEALADQVARLPGADALEALAARVTALESQTAAMQPEPGQISALTDRITRLESRPATNGGPSPAVLASMTAELAQLRAIVDAQQGGAVGGDLAAMLNQTRADLQAAGDKAQILQVQFEQTAQRATGRAAMLQIDAAIMAGGPFDAALDELAAGGIAVPDALRLVAGGVPSLSDLQGEFATPARAALAAALKATVGDSTMQRLSAFLRTQVGARSLTAQQGTDPDAILSRAEAALAKGNLTTVLAEIDTLPAAGRAELASWVAAVTARADAMDQVAALRDSLGK